jgi:hypothetical protein
MFTKTIASSFQVYKFVMYFHLNNRLSVKTNKDLNSKKSESTKYMFILNKDNHIKTIKHNHNIIFFSFLSFSSDYHPIFTLKDIVSMYPVKFCWVVYTN